MDSAVPTCDSTDEMAELALGLLTGADRASALEHLAACRACRGEVEQLARVADRLLLLSPVAEPPPGFESDVLAAMGAEATRENAASGPRNRRGVLISVMSAAAAAAVALAIGLALGSSSAPTEEMAWQAPMITPSGREVGEVRLQEGEPAWLLVSVPGWRRWDEQVGQALDYGVRLQMADGRTIELGDVTLSADGAWGTTTELDPSAIHEVSIVDSSGRVWCTGRL